MSVATDYDFLHAGMLGDRDARYRGEVARVEALLANVDVVTIGIEYPPLRDSITELERRGYKISWKATGSGWHYTFERRRR